MDLPDNESALTLSVVYQDPHLIEIETRVHYRDWSATARVYAGHDFFGSIARSILDWVNTPYDRLQLETGQDPQTAWLGIAFYTINRAGGVRCRVTLATDRESTHDSADNAWRLSIELPTELGLIERFGRECMTLGESLTGDARLQIA